MKRLPIVGLLALVMSFTVYAATQATATQDPQISITATNIRVEGLVTHMDGKVVIRTDKVLIEADEGDFNKDTRFIEVRGHVTIRLVSTSNGSYDVIQGTKFQFQLPLSKP